MMRFVKRLLGSRWLKWAVVVIAVGIGAYEIDKEWNQVHHALARSACWPRSRRCSRCW